MQLRFLRETFSLAIAAAMLHGCDAPPVAPPAPTVARAAAPAPTGAARLPAGSATAPRAAPVDAAPSMEISAPLVPGLTPPGYRDVPAGTAPTPVDARPARPAPAFDARDYYDGARLPAFAARGLTSPYAEATALDELRRVLGADSVERVRGGTPYAPRLVAGQACAACERKIAALHAPDGGAWTGLGPSGGNGLVITRGEVVTVAWDRERVGLLGPIDHPAKAHEVALAAGYRVDLAAPWVLATKGGFEVRALRTVGDCPRINVVERIRIDRDGELEVRQVSALSGGGCAGRRPRGLVVARPHAPSALGQHLARNAHLEAASVTAFALLADELRAHGAPPRLIRAARRAGVDEVRHAAAMTRLAARHGARVPAVRVRPAPRRSLRALAIENAREGCVRETWAALEAAYQATVVADPTLRRTLGAIARDEARHAHLAWQVARWLAPRLSPADRAAVGRARSRAVAALRRELAYGPAPVLVASAGLPTAGAAAVLLDTLVQRVALA